MTPTSRLQMIEEMLAETPDDPELRYAQAMEYASQGQDEAAVRHFQAMFDVSPNYAPAYHQCGLALVRLNRVAQAQQVLERGITTARQSDNLHAAEEMAGLLASLRD